MEKNPKIPDLNPRDHKVILTVGTSYSGKSTWARTKDYPIVNPDAIRVALHGQRFLPASEPMVWVQAKYMLFSLFYAGHHTVIVDATNTTLTRRSFWNSPRWSLRYMWFDVDREECRARALALHDEEILPYIETQAEAFRGFTPQELTLIPITKCSGERDDYQYDRINPLVPTNNSAN